MGKSATQLGNKCGLTAQEFNQALKEAGFLDGNPGEWFVTEKGKPFANQEDHHRGTGGSPVYNAYWTETFWNPSIMNELDLSPEHKQEIRVTTKEERRARREAREEEARLYWEGIEQQKQYENDSEIPLFDAKTKLIGGSAIGLIVGGIILWPHAKAFWNEKIKPTAKRLLAKIRKNKEKEDDSTNEDNASDS